MFRSLLTLIAFLFINQGASAQPRAKGNLWDVLAQQFTLNHEMNRPEVQKQINWIIKHPTYLKQLTNQSRPYLYYVTMEIRKKKLPGELALIPMIESGYNPFAYSGVGAAGIWQMMPNTGTTLGLKQDWWADNRRNITTSTSAALHYLQYLNKFFKGNWTNALAAYDSGEGTVARAMRKSRNKNFWSLSLPRETKAYIPRLMAIAEIIENPARYKVVLPNIPNTPYFTEVSVDSHVDLSMAAKLAGISYQELIRLNPGHNRWTTSPNKALTLLIPVERADSFYRNLVKLPKNKRASLSQHQVMEKESLAHVANQYHTTTTLLKAVNQLQSNLLNPGQILYIPNVDSTTLSNMKPNDVKSTNIPEYIYPNKYRVLHIIDEGDTMRRIQRRYDVTAMQIKNWNQMQEKDKLQPGTQLIIWKNDFSEKTHRVTKGDTFIRIASKHKISVNKLRKLNPKISDLKLRQGQKIKLKK